MNTLANLRIIQAILSFYSLYMEWKGEVERRLWVLNNVRKCLQNMHLIPEKSFIHIGDNKLQIYWPGLGYERLIEWYNTNKFWWQFSLSMDWINFVSKHLDPYFYWYAPKSLLDKNSPVQFVG